MRLAVAFKNLYKIDQMPDQTYPPHNHAVLVIRLLQQLAKTFGFACLIEH